MRRASCSACAPREVAEFDRYTCAIEGTQYHVFDRSEEVGERALSASEEREIRGELAEVQRIVARGAKEITLLGQIVDSWGHDLPGSRLQVAAERPGANLNALFTESRRDPLSGNAVLSGVAVEMEPLSL